MTVPDITAVVQPEGRQDNGGQLDKQRWLRAWEKTGLSADDGFQKSTDDHVQIQRHGLTREQRTEHMGLVDNTEPFLEGRYYRGGEMLQQLATGLAQQATVVDRVGAYAGMVTDNSVAIAGAGQQMPLASAQAPNNNGGIVLPAKLTRDVLRIFPEINVHVMEHNGLISVVVRDFRGDDQRRSALLAKIKEVIKNSGQVLKSLIINGEQHFRLNKFTSQEKS